MKMGIIGFAGAGKKTLFFLLTGRRVPAGYKAGDAVEGVAHVPDKRVDVIAGIVKPKRVRYAEAAALLCPDISDDEHGRKWREAARGCDFLCAVVRSFTNEAIYHPAGSVDAPRDQRNLKAELILADMEIIENRITRIEKEKRGGPSPHQAAEKAALEECRQWLENEKELKMLELAPHEIEAVKSLGFLTMKPLVWTLNTDENEQSQDEANTARVSCKLEEEIAAVENPAERLELMQVAGLERPGVETLHKAAYTAMDCISFYTIVNDEVRAWTIRKGALAPAAAGKVHSDMERGFIRAEVIKFDDLVETGSAAAARQQGKAHVRGKDYVVEDGDICSFRFGV